MLNGPVRAAVGGGGKIEAAYIGYEIIRFLVVFWRFALERQQHPAAGGVEKEHTSNVAREGSCGVMSFQAPPSSLVQNRWSFGL